MVKIMTVIEVMSIYGVGKSKATSWIMGYYQAKGIKRKKGTKLLVDADGFAAYMKSVL